MTMHELQILLESVHPALPWAILTVLVWFGVYGVRRWLPDLWVQLESVGPKDRPASQVFQALPSIMMGALASVILMGGNFADSWKGAAAGALAPLVHHVLKALPGPYGSKNS